MAQDNAPAAPNPNARADEMQQNSIRETSRTDAQLSDGTIRPVEHLQAASTGEGRVASAPVNQRFKPEPVMHQPKPGMKIGAGPIVDTGFTSPPDLNPGIIDAIDGYEDHKDFLAPARTALAAAYDGLNAIAEGRKQAASNPSWNDYQQLLNVGTFAEKTHEKICKAFDTATSTLTKGIDHIDKELTAPLASAAASPFAREIRDHVKGLSPEKRGEFLANAMANNDTGALHALLGSPSYLSGLNPSTHEHQLRKYHERNKPGLLARQTAMKAALEVLNRRAPSIHKHAENALGGRFDTLQKVRKANTAAEKALAFQESNNPLVA